MLKIYHVPNAPKLKGFSEVSSSPNLIFSTTLFDTWPPFYLFLLESSLIMSPET